jgi:hypothetical protein
MSNPDNLTTIKSGSTPALLSRLFWMLLGNAVLLISGVSILHQDRGFHTADAVFGITVTALILVRYFDVKFWDGATCTGKPATMAHWRRYAVILLGLAGAIWAVLHLAVYLMYRS